MPDESVTTATYLDLINEMTVHLNELRDLMNDPDQRLTGCDAKYLVGGQLAYLAEKLSNLAKEIEQV
jgi:hypothetical protein